MDPLYVIAKGTICLLAIKLIIFYHNSSPCCKPSLLYHRCPCENQDSKVLLPRVENILIAFYLNWNSFYHAFYSFQLRHQHSNLPATAPCTPAVQIPCGIKTKSELVVIITTIIISNTHFFPDFNLVSVPCSVAVWWCSWYSRDHHLPQITPAFWKYQDRDNLFEGWFISAKAPANSTPVGPPPTSTKLIRLFWSTSVVKTACSKFSRIKLRIFMPAV
jgi:hypothetical protein